jgi:ABC transporter substrate binding protein (PQQ-dependent alcohol dehydrogenase system)
MHFAMHWARWLRWLVTAWVLFVSGAGWAADWRVTLLTWTDNPAFERARAERAYFGHPTGPALDGLTLAIEDARFELDAARMDVKLEEQSVNSIEAARAAAIKAQASGAQALVVDLPGSWIAAVAAAVKLPVLNVASASDALRTKDCQTNLFHSLPSERMRADALAQAMVARKWSQVVVLAGNSAEDAERLATVSATLKRFGLKTVAQKNFKLSADPRDRAQSNPILLTSGLTYDAAWVVDTQGEFARALPYNLSLPRPVVGDAGLTALAWHPQFERFGAPQVSRRFAKTAKRAMTAHDWSAWMAGKALAAVAIANPKPSAAAAQKALAQITLDGSKGVAMSFRAWDGQLRQPMLLTDGQGVIGTAPIEGLLHPVNNLDTLGADGPEKLCVANR